VEIKKLKNIITYHYNSNLQINQVIKVV